MLACARLGAVHSVVFGGFAANELAARIDDARPKVVVAASCGIEPTRVVEYKPLLDRALELAEHQPGRVRRQAAAAGRGDLDDDGATSTGTWRCGPAPADPARVRRRSRRPTRSTSSTRPARPASRRASSATTAATRSRWPGRCRTSTTSTPARCGGPPPTSAGSSATPTSSTRRCLPAPRPCSTRASRSAPRTPARSGGSSPSTGSRRCSPRRPRSGRSRRRTPRASCCAQHDLVARCARCSSPASGSTRTPTSGRREHARRPGGRQLVADRDRLADRGEPARPRADADQAGLAVACRCPGTTCGCSTRRASRCRPGDGGGDLHQAAAAAGHAADAVGRRRAVRRVVPRRPSTATTSPATAATSTRTATCSSWAAPTTSSTSPATGCRPARWRRCSPRTRRSPSAR